MQRAHRYILQHFAKQHGLPAELVIAVAMVESAGDTWAHRTEPAYPYLVNVRALRPYRAKAAGERRAPADFPAPPGLTADSEWIAQQTSWGLLQVMGAVAREYGFELPLPALCEPVHGVDYGCRHLARLRDRHLANHGWAGVLDAYNDGTARIERPYDYPHKVAAAGCPLALEGA